MAPSLAQHAGCTLIDINPGIGLWSSKLHEILKPQSHILLEDNQDIFLPFLQPLLDTPNSRYHLRSFADTAKWQPKQYIAEGLLPQLAEVNGEKSPVLIVANLADLSKHAPGRTKRGWSSHIKALDMAYTVRHGLAFQGYGPTRLLMWVGEEEKRAILPRTVHYRSKIAVMMESAFHVEEIAGAAPSASGARREDALEIESGKRVALRMKAKDIFSPPDRRVDIKDIVMQSSDVSRAWHAEMRKLEQGFENHEFSKLVDGPTGPVADFGKPGKPARGRTKNTPEYNRLRTLRNILRGENKRSEKMNRILHDQEAIDKLDLEAHREHLDAEARVAMLKILDVKIQDYKSHLKSLPSTQVNSMLFLDDDRRALAMDPPLLMWDRRQAEPLIVQPDEFYPSQPLALLDFQPKTDIMPMTIEQSMYFKTIATQLMGVKGVNNLRHLNTIAPGAYEALVAQVPAIRDPKKGGRRDVDSVRARNLTLEMLQGLAVAWDKWLFKPEMNDLLTQLGVNHEEGGLAYRKTSSRMAG